MPAKSRRSFYLHLISTPAVLGGLSGHVVSVGLLLASVNSAFALTKEAAIENCRMSVGRPIVQACMMALGGMRGPNGEANLASCRAKATPQVRACVMAALNAANGRANVAVEVPREAAPVVPVGTALPAGFVAPPRTIADITAILDSEKPDVKKIADLKEDADCQADREGVARGSRAVLFRSRQCTSPAWAARRIRSPTPARRSRSARVLSAPT